MSCSLHEQLIIEFYSASHSLAENGGLQMH